MNDFLALRSPVEKKLNKQRDWFTRADIMKFVREEEIKFFTFHYTGIDGKLKDLLLPLNSLAEAEKLLAAGERADGSSLFKGLVDTSGSDLYVVPVYSTAFLNPFVDKSLDFICRFFTKEGELADYTPDNALHKSYQLFREETGLELYALGELEFFLIGEVQNILFPAAKQAGYHQSNPFIKFSWLNTEMLEEITRISGQVKYGHAEVGLIETVRSYLPEIAGKRAEQFEIEYLPKPIDQMADDIVIGKWLIRNIAFRNNVLATFTPKIEEGIAGNGLHFHFEIRKNNKNIMVGSDGKLSKESMKFIGGIVTFARSLSVFGNTVASSYLRLVPNQEAPTKICWSDLNRSALIRVPLGWHGMDNLASKINPQEKAEYHFSDGRQTVELRSADGSAWVHALLTGVCQAARHGFKDKNSTKIAEKT
ncbi:glutamine synthetase, partial [bacterium]